MKIKEKAINKRIIWKFKSFKELTKEELYDIIQLRIAVFVVEQNAPYQDCDGKDFSSFHLFGEIEGEIVTYCRLLPAGLTYEEPCLGRVVTHPNYRHMGLGQKCVEMSLEAMKTCYKTTDCRISAQLYLQQFYESFGFKKVSTVYLEDNLPHIEMLK